MNVLHMLLPSGELWFCRLYNKALPLVSDARLRDDVQGFIRQEAMHSRAHDGAIQRYLSRFDIDSKPFTDKMDFLFERLLCDPAGAEPPDPRPRRLVAAPALRDHRRGGAFHLRARQVGAGGPELDRRGSDPVMLDLLRWHGAEEVEHRSVAHDLHVHLGGSFVTRQLTMLLVIAILVYLLADGTRTLLDQDPSLRGAKRQGFLNLVAARQAGPAAEPRSHLPRRRPLLQSLVPPRARGEYPGSPGIPGQLAGGPARGERLKTIHWKYRQAPRKLELSGACPLLRQVESNKPADGR